MSCAIGSLWCRLGQVHRPFEAMPSARPGDREAVDGEKLSDEQLIALVRDWARKVV